MKDRQFQASLVLAFGAALIALALAALVGRAWTVLSERAKLPAAPTNLRIIATPDSK